MKGCVSTFLMFLLGLAGCRTGPALKVPEIGGESWRVQRGQAIWRASEKAPQIAGDLLVATNSDGQLVVQFTKTPFPTIIAQRTWTEWQLQIFPQNRVITGRRQPPDRIIWFQLPAALAGGHLAGNWRFERSAERWRLENSATGESLEGYLSQ